MESKAVRMGSNGFIHIEIIHQGDHCASCQYMAEAVEQVLPNYGERIRFTKVEYMKSKRHARRFYDLSVSLYGEEELKKRLRCAPIPSLFIDGKLIFDVIPPQDELIEAIESALEDAGP
jgi:thiol-disulfide isomerase/thioredoxin